MIGPFAAGGCQFAGGAGASSAPWRRFPTCGIADFPVGRRSAVPLCGRIWNVWQVRKPAIPRSAAGTANEHFGLRVLQCRYT